MTSLSFDGGTNTIYIKYDSQLLYNINDGGWNTLTGPITITNTNASPATNVLKVLFTTDITVSNLNTYFDCRSAGIQFGSTSLKDDGTRPTIFITAANYEGFIRNGSSGTPGNNDIFVYNLVVDGTGGSQEVSAGWIGQVYFGKNATNNYIVNCSSLGATNGGTGAGGIVGAHAASGSGAELFLYGCSSSGVIGIADGGIVGGNAGDAGGSVTCEQCWSTGAISTGAGGIFGFSAGLNGGSAQAIKSYSTGVIGGTGGGIFGDTAGNTNGFAIAQQCYSRGNIAANSGGIFGQQAGVNSGTTSATNCYSAGTITTSGTGIYGSSKVNGTESQCYAANAAWNDTAANTALSGPPNPVVGTTWIKTGDNTPYELNAVGYTPYKVDIINSATSQLIQSYSQTVEAGNSSRGGIIPGASSDDYIILKKEGGDPGVYGTITINGYTGVIFTTTATTPGTYTLTVRSVGSYHITTFTLTVTEAQAAAIDAAITCCQRTMNLKGLDYDTRNKIITGNRVIADEGTRRQPLPSYQDYYYMKMAYASKR